MDEKVRKDFFRGQAYQFFIKDLIRCFKVGVLIAYVMLFQDRILRLPAYLEAFLNSASPKAEGI